ncbi:MAG: type II and III secretion system protein family protein [Vicinamibacterales bacterium]
MVTTPARAQPPTTAMEPEKVLITVGRSTVLPTTFDITRIAITNPTVADAVVVAPREVLIDGKGPGTVSLIVWGSGERRQYDVVVDQGTAALEQQLHLLFPGEDVRVSSSDDAVVLHGRVSSNEVSLRMAEIAAATASKAKVINMLELPGGSESQQVMLQVRVAEVNRRALSEAGLGLFAAREDFLARSTTQQFSSPDFDQSGDVGLLSFGDYLNLFFFHRAEGIGGVLRALQATGYFQTLAEPNLIAYNGQEASFLAGGEFPIPMIQGNTGQIMIQFKEFGVKLNFTPRIAGDTIRLRVRPEVSALDFNNGITLAGFRIPALTTRRAETEVELRDGQSFAIAGLLNNLAQNDSTAIPLLSRLPVIGPLFRSRAERQDQTELMVLVTPRLVRPLDPDEVPTLPTTPGVFLKAPGPDTGGARGTEGPLVQPDQPGRVR